MKPHTVVYAAEMTEEIQRMIDILSTNEAPITALQNEDNIVILQPEEIYMVKIEGGDTMIFGETQKYRSRKRLYELEQQLGRHFIFLLHFIISVCYTL